MKKNESSFCAGNGDCFNCFHAEYCNYYTTEGDCKPYGYGTTSKEEEESNE